MSKLWVVVNYVIREGKRFEEWRTPWPLTKMAAEQLCVKAKERDVYDGRTNTVWAAEQVEEF